MRSATMCERRIVRRSASVFVRARRGALSAIVNWLGIGSSGRGGMAAPRHVRDPLRGEVYLANRARPITIVAAITSRFDEELYPTEVPLRAREGGLSTD